jgi:phosphate transport system substrate-binding protein
VKKSVLFPLVIAAFLLAVSCGASNSGPSVSGVSLTAARVTAAELTPQNPGTTPAPPAAVAALKGKTLQIDGSSALQPFFLNAAKYFDQGMGTSTTAVANGSGNGLKDVEAGSVKIGMSDFFAQESSTPSAFSDLVDHRVAVVAFTLVVSKDISDKVQNLTQQQVIDIYTGKIDNWKQIGGPNEAITVVNRPLASGTRATFRKYVLNGATENAGSTLQQDSTGAVATAVESGQGAIGYVATGFVLNPQFSGIFPVCIDGYGATAVNLNSGNYKFWSFEHAYTKGTPEKNSVEQAFLDYVVTPDVQSTLLPTLGYIQVSQLSDAALATHPLPAGVK